MARPRSPIKGSLGEEIYNRYVEYCTATNEIPEPYVFWQKILVERDKYPISRSGFSHWLFRLQIGKKPYIWRDETTNAWHLRDVMVREK